MVSFTAIARIEEAIRRKWGVSISSICVHSFNTPRARPGQQAWPGFDAEQRVYTHMDGHQTT